MTTTPSNPQPFAAMKKRHFNGKPVTGRTSQESIAFLQFTKIPLYGKRNPNIREANERKALRRESRELRDLDYPIQQNLKRKA